jgi:hypothetical protein
VQFLNDKWEPCHLTIGVFEITKNFGSAMALQVNEMLAKHGLNAWVIAYVKDKGSNISTTTIILTFLFHVKCWGWQHHLWGYVGGMLLPTCHK